MEQGIWSIRCALGRVSTWERQALRFHYAGDACLETAKQTAHLAATFIGGAFLAPCFYVGYSIVHLRPPFSVSQETPQLLIGFSIVTGLACAGCQLSSSLDALQKRLYKVYDPDGAVSRELVEKITACFQSAVSLVIALIGVALPYYFAPQLVTVLLIGAV